MIIKVKVKPGASKNEVRKKGKANEKLVELLSDFFNVPKSKIEIIKGQVSREKQIKINP